MIRVFIVAPSPLARAGLQSLVGTRGVEIVGTAPNFESLADQWPDVEADIILIEASGNQFESGMDSIAALQLASESTIAVLFDRYEPKRLAEALRAGVRAPLTSGDLQSPSEPTAFSR